MLLRLVNKKPTIGILIDPVVTISTTPIIFGVGMKPDETLLQLRKKSNGEVKINNLPSVGQLGFKIPFTNTIAIDSYVFETMELKNTYIKSYGGVDFISINFNINNLSKFAYETNFSFSETIRPVDSIFIGKKTGVIDKSIEDKIIALMESYANMFSIENLNNIPDIDDKTDFLTPIADIGLNIGMGCLFQYFGLPVNKERLEKEAEKQKNNLNSKIDSYIDKYVIEASSSIQIKVIENELAKYGIKPVVRNCFKSL